MSQGNWRTARAGLRDLAQGRLTCLAWARECLDRLQQTQARIGAFAAWDRDLVLAQARALDEAGAPGELGGVPIAVKDVIDTADLPTEFNSPLYAGHQPTLDAACVRILRAAGALILGKATTVEFASLGSPPATANPANPAHTPGGSSSGSAAAVAAGIVPLALGTQTGGSTIRPASFCGVAGFKPTFGLVPVEGLRPYAPSLDTIGWMAREVVDLLLLARAFQFPPAKPPSTGLRLGFYKGPYWDQADQDSRAALSWARGRLEAAQIEVVDVAGPQQAGQLNRAQDTVMHGEGRVAYLAEYTRWPDRLHPRLRAEVENEAGIDGARLAWAYDFLGDQRPRFEQAMDGFDAWLTPAVPGEAPEGLDDTGDAVFNRMWTGLHMPAVTLPGFTGRRGLPVGIQLVAPRFADLRLLEVAARVESLLQG